MLAETALDGTVRTNYRDPEIAHRAAARAVLLGEGEDADAVLLLRRVYMEAGAPEMAETLVATALAKAPPDSVEAERYRGEMDYIQRLKALRASFAVD